MNLLQIAISVGQRTGLIDTNSQLACKNFLGIRHHQLWRSFLWKDSLCEFVLTIDPTVADYVPTNNYMPTKGNLILPPAIGAVIACRTNQNKMNVERPMIYYRVNQDQFIRSGLPLDFMQLPAAVWEFDTPQAIQLVNPNNADNGQMVTIDQQAADGVTINRSSVTLANNSVAAGTTDLVASIIKPATQGALVLGSTPVSITTVGPSALDFPKCQRLRFVGIPNVAATVRVLGKRVTPPFSADTDTPGVSGMEGVLFALAYYDMCYRDERQGEEIQSALNEAVGPMYLTMGKPGGFLAELIRLETEQAAYNSRIMPEEGFGGDEYFQGTWNTKSSPY